MFQCNNIYIYIIIYPTQSSTKFNWGFHNDKV